MSKLETFGQFVKDMCLDRGINGIRLSELSGVHRTTISRVLHDRYIGKSVYTRIAMALSFTFDDSLEKNLRRNQRPFTKQTSDQTFGGFISHLRVDRGLMIKEVAELTNIPEPTLSEIQQDKQLPSASQLDGLSESLGFTVEDPADFLKHGLQPLANSFGEFLRDLRKDRGLTRKQLAQLTGTTQRNIHLLELKSGLPGRKLLFMLMDTLGFTPENINEVYKDRGRPSKVTR